jgi:hypothetical protein
LIYTVSNVEAKPLLPSVALPKRDHQDTEQTPDLALNLELFALKRTIRYGPAVFPEADPQRAVDYGVGPICMRAPIWGSVLSDGRTPASAIRIPENWTD